MVLGFLVAFAVPAPVVVAVLPLFPVLFLATKPTPRFCSALSKWETWQNKTRRTNFDAVCEKQSNDNAATGQENRTT